MILDAGGPIDEGSRSNERVRLGFSALFAGSRQLPGVVKPVMAPAGSS